mgnify:CR=1 FL=1
MAGGGSLSVPFAAEIDSMLKRGKVDLSRLLYIASKSPADDRAQAMIGRELFRQEDFENALYYLTKARDIVKERISKFASHDDIMEFSRLVREIEEVQERI